MRIAIVGCGCVASLHMHSLKPRAQRRDSVPQRRPRGPVYLRRRVSFAGRSAGLPWRSKAPLVGRPAIRRRTPERLKKVESCLGPLHMAAAIRVGRPPRPSAQHVPHVAELALAIQRSRVNGAPVKLRSRFDPIEPMPWAR